MTEIKDLLLLFNEHLLKQLEMKEEMLQLMIWR